MKRKLKLLGILAIFCISISGSKSYGEAIPIEVDLGDIFTTNYCRCKHGGCYSGNAISFRAACAKGKDALMCGKLASNCYNN